MVRMTAMFFRWSLWSCIFLLIHLRHIEAVSLDSPSVDGWGTSTELSVATSSSQTEYLPEEGSGGTHDVDDYEDSKNETRDALTPESSDQDSVVYLSQHADYVPVSVPGSVPGSAPVHAPAATRTRSPSWERDYRRARHNSSRVQHIEAECQDDYMKIRVGFNGTFTGLVYSAGYSYDPDCMYVNGTGRDYYEFYIQLNRCGTLGRNAQPENRSQPSKNFMWNTITVQYNALIEEEFDEHFKVTCEYGYDFWKTVTFPFLDVEVATGNPVVFTLQPPECYMEIRSGYGAGGARVAGPVRVGDPLTLVIYMRAKYDGFDIVVNDCFAHNGANKKIQLIDEFGCPVDEKLISRFRGSWSETGAFETQVFAYMKTFRFTGSPALYIECDVRMCHGRCPSQPCHWRNAKSVQRRSADLTLPSASPAAPALSENVNLFQSLRVLQEGEEDEQTEARDATARAAAKGEGGSSVEATCGTSPALWGVLAACGASLCAALGALCTARSRLRRAAATDAHALYDHYRLHKGRIK